MMTENVGMPPSPRVTFACGARNRSLPPSGMRVSRVGYADGLAAPTGQALRDPSHTVVHKSSEPRGVEWGDDVEDSRQHREADGPRHHADGHARDAAQQVEYGCRRPARAG